MSSEQPKEHWQPYWLTPPDVYSKLNAEFHFDYDPCPFPRPEGYNGITSEWGQSNYVNPPFHRYDGIGPTAFARKAIEENKKGKAVVLVIPVPSYVNLLLEAGAELRSMGRIRWLHKDTKEPTKQPSPIGCFILRSRPHTPAPAERLGFTEFCYVHCDKHECCTNECERSGYEAARKAREQVLDTISKRLEKQGVEIHERNGQRYYVVEGTFNFASFMQWLESLRSTQQQAGERNE